MKGVTTYELGRTLNLKSVKVQGSWDTLIRDTMSNANSLDQSNDISPVFGGIVTDSRYSYNRISAHIF